MGTKSTEANVSVLANAILRRPTPGKEQLAGTAILDSYFSSDFTRYQDFQSNLRVARENEGIQIAERSSAAAAQDRANAIRARSSLDAQSQRVATAVTNSSRLYTEFSVQAKQREALATREADKDVGAIASKFGAAGIVSSAALADSNRNSTLKAVIEASDTRLQLERIAGSAREAISGALASGMEARGSLSASSQRGSTLERVFNTTGPIRKSTSVYL